MILRSILSKVYVNVIREKDVDVKIQLQNVPVLRIHLKDSILYSWDFICDAAQENVAA